MVTNFEYYNPQHLIFGCGTFQQLATLPMPGKKACIVCTPSRRYVDRAIELLGKQGIECVVYDKCRQNPDTTTIGNGAKFAKENGVDFLVSIGGGSTTDTAKCMGVLLYHDDVDNNIWNYVSYYEGHKEPQGMMPLVIVSTTSGTGTEADQSGVLTNEFDNIKLDVAYPPMWAVYSIVDPELQVSVPPLYTACQGMDVIFHCTESFLDKYHNPYTDMTNLTGLKYAAAAIEVAYREPDNIEARTNMAIASNMAGISESMVDLISLHGCGHALGSIHHDIPHGYALCLMAPALMDWYCQYDNEIPQRMAYLARVVGYGDTAEDYKRFIIDKLKALDMYYLDYSVYGVDPARCEEYGRKAVEGIAPYMDKDGYEISVAEATELYRKALAPRK